MRELVREPKNGKSFLEFSFPIGRWVRQEELAYCQYTMGTKLGLGDVDFVVWEEPDKTLWLIEAKKFYDPQKDKYTANIGDKGKLLDLIVKKLFVSLLWVKHHWEQDSNPLSKWRSVVNPPLPDKDWTNRVLIVLDVEMNETDYQPWESLNEEFDLRFVEMMEFLMVPRETWQTRLKVELITPLLGSKYFPTLFPAQP